VCYAARGQHTTRHSQIADFAPGAQLRVSIWSILLSKIWLESRMSVLLSPLKNYTWRAISQYA